MSEPQHPYHLVEPSRWPILGAIAAFMSAYGLILFMHDEGHLLLLLGLGALGLVLIGWWHDVIREAEKEQHHNPIVQIGLRYGMALFIASEVMFFVAWFWAFFDGAFYPGDSASAEMISRTEVFGGEWPPADMREKVFNPWSIPFLNTLILLSSGATITWSHHALREGNRPHFLYGLILTIVLGISFTILQAHEYDIAQFTFAFDEEAGTGGLYSSTFFMATGFHGLHVIIGTVFLLVCLLRALAGHFTPKHHVGFEAATWYWHFVDVVWLFLFTFVYWVYG